MFKKIFFVSALLYSFNNFGQAIELRDVNGGSGLINGTLVTIQGSSHDADNDISVDIEAKSIDSNRTIMVKKKEIFTGISGMNNAICWISCSIPVSYGSQPVVSTSNLAVNKDSTHIFNGHLYPNTLSGQTTFRYVFYDVDRPNDTAYVDVLFDVYDASSVNEVKADIHLKVFPNPARDGQVTIKLNEAAINNSSIIVTDILGKVVFEKNTTTTKTIVNTSKYKSGIYFVSLEMDNEVVKTQKIIVSN